MFPEDAIFFFDFDGVMIEQCEEKLYQLESGEDERTRLELMANEHLIDHTLYPTDYLRHLIYQAVTPEPCKSFAPVERLIGQIELQGNPYFIVTSRSGTYALKRVFNFLESYWYRPQETFCLGRSPKAQLLSLLRTEWPDRPFVFMDDTRRHIDGAMALDDPLLTVVEIVHNPCVENAKRLNREHLGG